MMKKNLFGLIYILNSFNIYLKNKYSLSYFINKINLNEFKNFVNLEKNYYFLSKNRTFYHFLQPF